MTTAVETIPAELRQRDQWLCWRYKTRDGKATKAPVAADGKRAGDSTDPSTWADFETALATMSADGLDGIGFVFTSDDPYVGIDLDGPIQNGRTEQWAQDLIDRFDTYTEITPSGAGYHLILKGELPPGGRRTGSIEVYDQKRFFTVTGLAQNNKGVEDRSEALKKWHAEIFGEEREPAAPPEGSGFAGGDADLIATACSSKNGQKFARLWSGDLSDYEGDHSSADLALCSLLTFWTGGDTDRIDRLFRQSHLFRAKWDEKRGDQTYGQRTIQQAMTTCREFYSPRLPDDEIASQLDRLNKRTERQASAARPYIHNVHTRLGEDGEEQDHYTPPEIMLSSLTEGTGGWPRAAGGVMFVRTTRESDEDRVIPSKDDVRLLRNQNALHGWLHETCDLHFSKKASAYRGDKKVSLVTKGEFFEIVQAGIENYEAVEMLPHYPQVPGIYYWPCELPSSDGSALEELLNHLNPETEEDRGLMLAALLTPGWGGPPGARPAFVFCSAHGRGSGKTSTAELFGRVWGGHISVAEDEDWQQVKTRLLSDESFTSRVVLIDNLKGKLSRSGLEAAITSSTIDGKRMYVGQASRPNLLTWYITANTPELSRDLADRSIIIHVGKPQHRERHKEWAEEFLSERRPHVLADLMAILRGEQAAEIPASAADRWRMWQSQVLGRLDNGAELARAAIDKRPDVDSDQGAAEDVAGVIRQAMESKGFDPDNEALIFSTRDLHDLLVEDGLRPGSASTQSTTAWLKHHLDIEPLKACLDYRAVRRGSRTSRCWVWTGAAWQPEDSGNPLYNVPVYAGQPTDVNNY